MAVGIRQNYMKSFHLQLH